VCVCVCVVCPRMELAEEEGRTLTCFRGITDCVGAKQCT
jgi:hypothetical protein